MSNNEELRLQEAAQRQTMEILSIIARADDGKVGRAYLAPQLRRLNIREPIEQVMQPLVDAGYVTGKTKYGSGSYTIQQSGRDELQRLQAEYGDTVRKAKRAYVPHENDGLANGNGEVPKPYWELVREALAEKPPGYKPEEHDDLKLESSVERTARLARQNRRQAESRL